MKVFTSSYGFLLRFSGIYSPLVFSRKIVYVSSAHPLAAAARKSFPPWLPERKST